jgi:hypothetical protein
MLATTAMITTAQNDTITTVPAHPHSPPPNHIIFVSLFPEQRSRTLASYYRQRARSTKIRCRAEGPDAHDSVPVEEHTPTGASTISVCWRSCWPSPLPWGTIDTFVSVWCLFAVVLSALVYIHFTRSMQTMPPVFARQQEAAGRADGRGTGMPPIPPRISPGVCEVWLCHRRELVAASGARSATARQRDSPTSAIDL